MKNNKAWYIKAYNAVKGFVVTKIAPSVLKLYNNKFLLCVVSAFIINSFIEVIWRRSLSSIIDLVVFNPHMFIYGTALIALTLCVTMFFKKRLFVYLLIAGTWIGFGIANSTLLTYRSTPMIAIDFMIMRSSIGISTVYLSVFVIILIVLAVLAAIALLVFILRKCRKEKVDYKRSFLQTVGVGAFVATLATMFYFTEAVPSDMRLPEIHQKCGYAYCLTYSLVDYGVDEPEVYTNEYMQEIRNTLDSVEQTVPEEKPNIIFLQLESFMDMNRIEGIELSDDPHPYFSKLKEENPSGKLTVNALGASTANVEFEVLTGTYIKDYGFDEYPYKTFLRDTAIETIAYDLKNLGYATTAMHNHDGGFYSRNTAYANLGFDRFIPRECMTDLEYTPTGWAKDKVISRLIKEVMAQTEEKDFVFAVTVQCHSKYPTEVISDMEYTVTAGGFDDEEYVNMLSYYATQVREEDEFLKELLSYLENYEEKTMVVLYGDHLPTFIKESDQLTDGVNDPYDAEKYNSEYVIWTNYGIEAEDKDLTACQLASEVLDHAGIRTGNIMRLYHADIDETTMEEYRHAITYDIVDGGNHLNGGKKRYETTDLIIGMNPIEVNGYELREESLYIYGNGFTEDANVYINGALYASGYVNPNILKVNEQVTVENGDSISVSIVTFDFVKLTTSKEFVINDLPHKVTANKGVHGVHSIILWGSIVFGVVALISVAVVLYTKKRKKRVLNFKNTKS